MLARIRVKSERPLDRPCCKSVTYFAYAGLGNRLRAHMMAQAYALRTGRELVVSWDKTRHLSADFGELFVWDGPTTASYKSSRRLPYVKGELSPQSDRENFEEDIVCFDAQWQFVDSEYLFQSLGDFSGVILGSLRPEAKLAEQIAKVKSQWPKSVVGIHVRRGDFVTHTGQAISLDRYITATRKVLSTMPDDTHLFMASDASDAELLPIQEAFYGKIERCAVHPRESAAGAQASLRDLLLLSGTNHLVLTGGSTFGEFAALYGKVPVTFA